MVKAQRHKKSRSEAKTIAMDSISRLFRHARDCEDQKVADRNVGMARKIAMKAGIRIPSECKRQFCHHCYSFLAPGRNCRVRNNRKTISYFCENCRNFNRIPYKSRKSKK